MAAHSVREVFTERDEDGLTYARKAMTITGMAISSNGLCQVTERTPELQRIVEEKKRSSTTFSMSAPLMVNKA